MPCPAAWGTISLCLSPHPSSQEPLQPHKAAEQESREEETARKEAEKQEKLKTHPNPFAHSSCFRAGCERAQLYPAPASHSGRRNDTLGEVTLRTDTTCANNSAFSGANALFSTQNGAAGQQ